MVKRSPQTLRSRTRKKWLTIFEISAAKKKSGDNSEPKIRVVVDTNVWYSAIAHGGNAEKVVVYCLNSCSVVVSEEIVMELQLLLRDRLKVPYRWLNEVMSQIRTLCEVMPSHDGRTLETVIRDPKDAHVVAAAILGECNVLVTGDSDFLELDNAPVLVVGPADFLKLVR